METLVSAEESPTIDSSSGTIAVVEVNSDSPAVSVVCSSQSKLETDVITNNMYTEQTVVDCSVTDVESNYEWKTTHAKALYRLLGFSKNLELFDTIHISLRQRKKSNLPIQATDVHTHSRHVAFFQTEVSKELRKLKKQISEMEVVHYKSHNCIPNDPVYTSLMKKVKLSKKLLAEWNVCI